MTSATPRPSRLVRAFTMVLATGALAVASTASAGVLGKDAEDVCARIDAPGRVTLVAARGETAQVLARVRRVRGSVCDRFGATVDAILPEGAARALRDETVTVLPAPRPYALGASEGVATTNADVWQERGLAGAGVKVAVIDLGFGGLADAQAAGYLPRTAVSVDYCSGNFSGERHGTAVAEVVADVAPATQLYLICVDDLVSLARAAAYVVANRIPIVNHSVGWFNTGPGDGSGGPGTPDRIIADARTHGVLWINAAGNEVRHHWRGTFVDADRDRFLDFAPGDDDNYLFVTPGAGVCVFLRWYEWPSARTNYVLSLEDDATGLTAVTAQAEGEQPLRTACWGNPRFWNPEPAAIRIRIQAPAGGGTAPLELFVEGTREIEHFTAAGSIADPATSPKAFAVGAICWQTGELEPYSSQGPTIDGRTKPDLVAPDSVSSPTYGDFSRCGSSGFTGTSAAAPHVAGAAALVKQRYPRYTPEKLESYLRRNAHDLGTTGPDNLYGAGSLFLPSTPN